jgi:hypothetical protein
VEDVALRGGYGAPVNSPHTDENWLGQLVDGLLWWMVQGGLYGCSAAHLL